MLPRLPPCPAGSPRAPRVWSGGPFLASPFADCLLERPGRWFLREKCLNAWLQSLPDRLGDLVDGGLTIELLIAVLQDLVYHLRHGGVEFAQALHLLERLGVGGDDDVRDLEELLVVELPGAKYTVALDLHSLFHVGHEAD